VDREGRPFFPGRAALLLTLKCILIIHRCTVYFRETQRVLFGYTLSMSKGPGRPAGSPHSLTMHIRLRAEDAEDLARLAARWRVTHTEAMRRALRETAAMELARREGVAE
jgi:hypothetical protein